MRSFSWSSIAYKGGCCCCCGENEAVAQRWTWKRLAPWILFFFKLSFIFIFSCRIPVTLVPSSRPCCYVYLLMGLERGGGSSLGGVSLCQDVCLPCPGLEAIVICCCEGRGWGLRQRRLHWSWLWSLPP